MMQAPRVMFLDRFVTNCISMEERENYSGQYHWGNPERDEGKTGEI